MMLDTWVDRSRDLIIKAWNGAIRPKRTYDFTDDEGATKLSAASSGKR